MTETIVCIGPKNLEIQVSLTRFPVFFESKTFCGLIKIIPVSKPSSKPFRNMSVKKDSHRLVKR